MTAAEIASRTPSHPRIQTLALLALLVAISVVYWPGRNGGFVFDDYPNIVNNLALRVSGADWNEWIAAALSSPARALPRPLAMLSFAVNYYFTGLDPVPMKVTNIAIHLLNTLLVFGLVRGLARAYSQLSSGLSARPDLVALMVAAFWALHPINLMAVLLVVQRMESMSHAFVFAGLLLYLSGRARLLRGEPGWARILTGLLPMTALGALAKESAVLLPLYAFCIEVCLFRFRTMRAALDRRLLLLFALVLFFPAVLALALLVPDALRPGAFGTRDFTLAERLMTEPRVIFDYLKWTLLPDVGNLSLFHDQYRISRGLLHPATTLAAILGLPFLFGIALMLRRHRPLSSLGVLWFLAAHALTATVIPLELVFEHRNYFASLGLGLVIADLLLLAPSTPSIRRMGIVLACVYVVVLAGLTHLRAREWSDSVSFAYAEVRKHPDSPRATYYLGWMLATATEYRPDSKLIDPALEALDRARKVPVSTMLPDQAALVLAARTGRPLRREWWQHMQERLRERPIGPQETAALGGLVTCVLESHCAFPPDDMLDTFGAALSRGPNPQIFNIYANYVFNVFGDQELGLRLWNEARALDPGEPQFLIAIIKVHILQGRYVEASNEIVGLRKLGRLGQYAILADQLEQRLRDAIAMPH